MKALATRGLIAYRIVCGGGSFVFFQRPGLRNPPKQGVTNQGVTSQGTTNQGATNHADAQWPRRHLGVSVTRSNEALYTPCHCPVTTL